MHVDVSRSEAQQLLYLVGERILEERSLVEPFVQDGMRVVDVGANIGYFTLFLRKLVGSSGEVISIEPSNENLPELRRNIATNGLDNVVLHEVAVGATRGESGMRTGINGGVVEGGLGCEIRQLDELVQEQVDFIKIDVDGYEGHVLRGSENVLRRWKPTLLVEVHPHILGRFGFTTRQIFDQLSEHYSHIEAYDWPRPESLSVLEKLSSRYLPRNLQPTDVERIIDASDNGEHSWAFWFLCHPER